MSRRKQIALHIVFDFIAALTAWAIFYLFRKIFLENFQELSISHFFANVNFFLGIFFVPLFWVCLYYISGYYRFIFRKTPSREIVLTFSATFIGVIVLFFALLLDDVVRNYHNYYLSAIVLFCLHFIITLIPRLVLSSITISKVHKNKICFNTIIIGCSAEAVSLYHELQNKKPGNGNRFIGFVRNPSASENIPDNFLPELGNLEKLPLIMTKYKIEEIIIAISPSEHKDIPEIISWLGFPEIMVKAVPGLNRMLKGSVQFTNVLGTLLIELKHELMPFWQQVFKAVFDFVFALLALIILSPIMLFCSVGIKLTSKGPVFYSQERIGKNGLPFMIYKFRSMIADAEKTGPNLTIENDHRMTSFGKFLRRTKLDEIPNFINILKGDMSLVGPRPERQFFINQIVKVAPHYLQLQKIKPGITSLGQVKYGYARNVDEMVKRLRFDILYMENMSVYTDFLIMYYTMVLLFKGRHV